MGCKGVNWIKLAQNGYWLWFDVVIKMNLCFVKAEEFLGHFLGRRTLISLS
jgi:hypothetical protein